MSESELHAKLCELEKRLELADLNLQRLLFGTDQSGLNALAPGVVAAWAQGMKKADDVVFIDVHTQEIGPVAVVTIRPYGSAPCAEYVEGLKEEIRTMRDLLAKAGVKYKVKSNV